MNNSSNNNSPSFDLSDEIEEIFINNDTTEESKFNDEIQNQLNNIIEDKNNDDITEIVMDNNLSIPEIILNSIFTSINNDIQEIKLNNKSESEKIQEVFNIGGTEISISSKNVKLFNIDKQFINKDVYYLQEYIEILKKYTINDILELINELPDIMINEGVDYKIIPTNYKREPKIKLTKVSNNNEFMTIYNGNTKHILNKYNLPENNNYDDKLFRYILYLIRNGELPVINKSIINILNELNIEYTICNNNYSLIYEPIKYDAMKIIHKNINNYLEEIPVSSIFTTVFYPTSENTFDFTKLNQKSKYNQYISDINLIIDTPTLLPFDKLFKTIKLFINGEIITRYSYCIKNYLLLNNKNINILLPNKTIIEHEGIQLEIYRYTIPLHFLQEHNFINLSNNCKIILDNDKNSNCYLLCSISLKNEIIKKPILFDDMIYNYIDYSKMTLNNNKYYYKLELQKGLFMRYLYFHSNDETNFISMTIKHNNTLIGNVDSNIIKYHQYKYFNNIPLNVYSLCENPLLLNKGSSLGGIISDDVSIEFCLKNDTNYLCLCLIVNKIVAC